MNKMGTCTLTILQEIVCVPCPLEDQNGFLVSNLDDGHILLIGRVLEIKPKELVVFICFMEFPQTVKSFRDDLAIVGVGDVESLAAWCGHRENLKNGRIHGGGLGREMAGEEEEERAAHCSRSNEASASRS